ncbi:S8 family serine peptidase [Phycicoccus sp. Root101]|uniref:S8 family peptidase n=1 Tax=Phycicoccus sp. Root101 TaxID=1736421 RepID=UPI00070295F7|nr:S8 family serine peptidase [Phycicoccus sp. Root101]KQU70427.1 peptidase S8 [Phycicoccus sp. Root101]
MSHRTHRPRSARSFALVASGALVAATFLTGGSAAAGTTGGHGGDHGPRSTPVPVLTPDGFLMSYVVNAKHANPGQTRLVERAVRAAGGVVVQSWPQIGVVVAHSDRAAFRADVVRKGGQAVESVGASRTAEVSEGTPSAESTRSASATRSAARTAATMSAGSATLESVTPDPREGEQWDNAQIKADQAHQVTDGSRKVVVGVLDSGIEGTHPDLAANIDTKDSVNCTTAGRPDLTPGAWNPTTSGHGTHVAGTIAAARNGVGIVGVAPNVRLASVKVVNDDGFIYPEYAICGFVWAGMHKMDVTNNSYYIDPMEFWCDDQPDQAAVRTAVQRAVSWSTKQGVVHAAAAGNSGKDLANKTTDTASPNDTTPITRTINDGCKDIPTELPGVVTVSATTQATTLASFSNRGLGVIDVAAPGRSILSTYPGGTYAKLSGTSMASPHVAGVLALMKSAHPSWSPETMIEELRKQADDHACAAAENNAGPACVGPAGDNSYYGEGIVDALDAVRKSRH